MQKGRKLGSRQLSWSVALLCALLGGAVEAQEFQATQVRFEPTVNRAVDIELSRFGSYTAVADWSDGNSVRLLDGSWQLLWKHRQQVFWGGTFRNASLLQFAPDESFLVYPAYRTDNDIAVVDTKTGEPLAVLADHNATVVSLALSPDAAHLVSATNAQLFLWRRQGKGFAVTDRIGPYKPAIQSIAFSPNGRLVAVVEAEDMKRRLVVYEIDSAKLIPRYTFENEERNLSKEYGQLVFSPDGRWIAAGYSDSLRIWRSGADASSPPSSADGTNGRETGAGFRLAESVDRIELGPVHAVRFSPDGELLLSGHSRDVRVWRLDGERWRNLTTFTPHHGHVVDLEFSPDGANMAIGGSAETNGAGLWSTTGVGASDFGRVLTSLRNRVSSAQKRLLSNELATKILSSVPNEYTAPRDMFETKEEYAARRAAAARAVASRLQEETEQAFSAERSPLPAGLYRVSIPLQTQGTYEIDSSSYSFRVMDSAATVRLGRRPARELYQNWHAARLLASRFDTPEGPTYADFRIAIPGVEGELPVRFKENPFTGERLDEFGARVPVVSVGPDLLVRDLRIDGVFPTLARHYAAGSLGTATLQNTGAATMSGLSVSLLIPGRMQSATPAAAPVALGVGQSVKVLLPALLDTDSLGRGGQESVTAEISISYVAKGQRYKEVITRPIGILGRNAIRWDDDRKVASFMTTTDPALLRYSGQVVGMVEDTETGILTRSFLTAMRLFSAMKASGLHYVVDPRSAYESLSKDSTAIDFVRFPVETLDARSGDCDDLSVLYNTLLESVGVSTGFITIPGHIFSAFDTGVPIELVDRFAAKPEEIIAHEGTIWIPVETTLLEQGFMKAWKTAAVEWRQASSNGGADFFTTKEAWRLYPSTDLSSAASALIPAASSVVPVYAAQLTEYRKASLTPKEIELKSRLAAAPAEKMENELGVLYAQFGLFDRALERFKTAASAVQYLPALINAASVFSLQKNYEQARVFLKRAADIDPQNAHILVRLAYSYYQGGDEQEARKAFDRMTKIDPVLAERFPLFGPAGTQSASGARAGRSEDRRSPFSIDWISQE